MYLRQYLFKETMNAYKTVFHSRVKLHDIKDFSNRWPPCLHLKPYLHRQNTIACITTQFYCK